MEHTNTVTLTTSYQELPTASRNITISSDVNTLLYFGKEEPTASSSHHEVKPHEVTSFTSDVPVYVKGTTTGKMVVSYGVLFKKASADTSGGGTGGVTAHTALTGRNVADQHPALAIHTEDLSLTNIQGKDLKENLESIDTLFLVKGKTDDTGITVDSSAFKVLTGANVHAVFSFIDTKLNTPATTNADDVVVDPTGLKVIKGTDVQTALGELDTSIDSLPTGGSSSADDVTADDSAFGTISGKTVQELLKSTDDTFNAPVTASDVSLDDSKLSTLTGKTLQEMVEETDKHVTVDNSVFGTLTGTTVNALFTETDTALTQGNINYATLSARVTALENP